MAYLILSLISASLHAYVGWRLLPALTAYPAEQALLGGVLLASALLLPFGLFARRIPWPHLAVVLGWGGLLCMGLFSSLFVLTVLRDLALFVAALLTLAWPGSIAYSSLEAPSALLVAALALGMTLWGYANARRTAAVVSVDIPIDGLPEALQGFRIAQISDMHVGPTIKHDDLRAVVEAVNRLGADLIAVTGDLVDGSVADLARHVAPLRDLVSVHGSFFVTGNHEYYSGAHAWIAEVGRLGVRVLLNQHVVVERGGASLVVAGVTDYSAHRFDPAQRSDPHAALAGAPADAGFRLLLAHQPRSATAAAQAGFDLQLSGHTHGGQFFPWNYFVRLQQPFTAGLHRLGGLWVYTSRGTGYWGPPKRFGAPSEITLLRLVCAAPPPM